MDDVAHMAKLTLKEKLFAERFANPKSETFSNKTQSYLSVYKVKPDTNPDTVRQSAMRLSRKPHIASYIEQVMEDCNMDSVVRVNSIAQIVNGSHIKVTKIKNAKGEVVKIVEQSVTPQEIIKGVDTLNRMDGTYEKRKAEGTIAVTEYRKLRKEMLARMREDVKVAGGD